MNNAPRSGKDGAIAPEACQWASTIAVAGASAIACAVSFAVTFAGAVAVTGIVDVFDSSAIAGKLLILGAPGMCFLNNAAIAARELLHQFTLVAILDIDMHHGNGTQQIFYQHGDVLTISIHGLPTNFYPFYTGFENERGSGEGYGYNLNIPLPTGTNEASYIQALEKAIDAISSFKAEALVVATGFDTFKFDPLGCFALESTSYNKIGRKIKSLCLPTLFVQEGGYFVEALSENVRQLVTGFESA
nr:hypothetical protein [Scytonema sp. UIC 10036]